MQNLRSAFVSTARVVFGARAEVETNARALETEGRAQLVLQVAFVGEVQRLWIVDEENKSGRVDLRLRRVIDLERFIAENRRVVVTHSALHNLIEPRGRNAQVAHISNTQNSL